MEDQRHRIERLKRLSERELEVLHEQCAGKVYAEIAERLAITTATVQFHATNIYRKLELDDLAKAARQRELGKFCLALTALQTKATSPLLPLPAPKIVDDMAYVPEGVFVQGSTTAELESFARLCAEVGADCEVGYFVDEQPQRRVSLAAFYIDVYELTNAKFQRFVDATSYRTTVEVAGKSLVWCEAVRNFQEMPDADWRHPQGPESTISGRMNNPVVHVSYADFAARAFRDYRACRSRASPTTVKA